MMAKKKSQTNVTTRDILQFLTQQGCFVWRQNVLPIPLSRKGILVGYRSGGRAGIPDIIGVVRKDLLSGVGSGEGGIFLGVEVKTGHDKLRDEQIGFHQQAQKVGAIILVVKDFEDFLKQWNTLLKLNKSETPTLLDTKAD